MEMEMGSLLVGGRIIVGYTFILLGFLLHFYILNRSHTTGEGLVSCDCGLWCFAHTSSSDSGGSWAEAVKKELK